MLRGRDTDMSASRLSTEDRPAGALYGAYFGLAEAPFSIAPDPRYLFMSERHREALAHLLYGVGDGGGFVQLTGEVGTGKTTLCRALLEQLPAAVDVALILNPRLTALELLATVCDELQIPYRRETTSLKELVDALYRHLLAAHGRGRRTVLVIDEAQGLAPDVLEQVRLLTNLETDREKLLQIVLIGQPELLALLDRPDLRQLAQRVTARYHLLPFSERETRRYIRHRLRVAGRADTRTGERLVFSDEAVREVHHAAGGVPRIINVICDRALLGAYAHDRSRIDGATARQAAREVLGRRSRRLARPAVWVGGLALVGAIAGAWLLVTPERLRQLPERIPGLGRAGARLVAVWTEPRDTLRAPVVNGGAPAAPAAPARLADLLADSSLRSDRRSALRQLYARWRPDRRDVELGRLCDYGWLGELRCLARAGTWTRLRRFDAPAVIELATPGRDRHYATLTWLGEEEATLELDNRSFTFPLAEIDRHWDGAFTILWKPPAGLDAPVLGPGGRGKDVAWLRQRLAALGGAPEATGGDSKLYDETLMRQVVEFQRSRLLVPDGIVGEETLAQLTLAVREPGTPSLSGSRP